MYFKSNKGVTLMALTITIIVMLIITGTIIYNTNRHLKIDKVNKLYNDIENLNTKIENYYLKYGDIPTTGSVYCDSQEKLEELLNKNAQDNEATLNTMNRIVFNPNDGDEYYIIDLEKLEGLTLNYGLGDQYKEFKQAINGETEITDITIYDEIYIINKASHQIYYPAGIFFNNYMYYSYTIDNNDVVSEYNISSSNGKLDYDKTNSINIGEFKIYGNSVLTDEYQQVEYIESTGTQYIETNFIPNQDTRVVVDFEYTSTNGSFLFGTRGKNHTNAYTVNIGSSNQEAFTSFGSSGNVEYDTADKNRHLIDKNKNELYLDGVLKATLSNISFTCPWNFGNICNI